MRAELKALAVPEGPAADDTKADTDKRQHARTWLRPGRSWSSLLLGGAVLALFGIGYLAVDLFTAPGVAPALQQSSPAPATEGQPATGPVRLKAERGSAPEPQSAPRTGKSEIAPATPDNEGEALPPPAAQPTRRPPRETQNDDVGSARSAPAPGDRPDAGFARHGATRHATGGKRRRCAVGIDTLASLGVDTAALRTAAAHGDALAQLEVATRFAEGDGVAKDHKLAFAWYERAAMRGLATAQFRLAAYYERGVGVAIDSERAKIWYRRAAEQGHVRSMHNLAVLVVGSGKDDADYAAAAHWFQQAADRGLSDSQFNLAVLYAHGRGVAKDLTEVLQVVRPGCAIRRRRSSAQARGGEGAARNARAGGCRAEARAGLAREAVADGPRSSAPRTTLPRTENPALARALRLAAQGMPDWRTAH